MANVRFFIRDKQSKKTQPIYLVYNLTSNDKFVYPTNIKILPKFWDFKKYKVKNVAQAQNKEAINKFLNELRINFESYILKLKLERKQITKPKLKAFTDEYFNKTDNEKNLTLTQFIINFINERKTRINTKINKVVSIGTIKNYKTVLQHLNNYQKEYKTELLFDNIDLDFYYNFIDFLQKKYLSLNTIGKYIKTLKIFLNDATIKGINTNKPYKSDRFRTLVEESDQIYLNEIELQKIANLNLTNNERLEKVRDVFLLGCWTGLRYSDYSKIQKKDIENNYLTIKQQKTGKTVVIPLHPVVKKIIIDKYNFELPKHITNQKFNDYLKELGKLANINTPTSKEITKGGLKITETKPKYNYISTHTARRSFATNIYKQEVPTITIMSITGHKTEKSFLKYIKVEPQEHAKILNSYWQKQGKYLEVVNKN